MLQSRRAVLTAIAVALVGCGGAGADSGGYGTGPSTTPTAPGTTPGVATNTVSIGEASFDPGNVVVPIGTTITWVWNSCPGGTAGGYSTCVAHNVTFDDGSGIASGTETSGTFSRTFTAAGTFKYHCTIHGAAMTAQITIK